MSLSLLTSKGEEKAHSEAGKNAIVGFPCRFGKVGVKEKEFLTG